MISASQLVQQIIIPVYSNAETMHNKRVLKACFYAGLRYFEFTNRHENSLDAFIELKNYADAELPGMVLGAGTIKNNSDAELFWSAGAAFLVSPLISGELIAFTKKKNILWIPGCATASEAGMAENEGIQLIKLFPVSELGGADFIKALKAPFQNMQFLATGGISGNADEIKRYLQAGAASVGLGNSFFTEQLSEEELTAKLVNLLNALKS
jgi:2-dehydro-3-deoxyphosphogluconate aldolase / (4S)-4-hydroxy-2-oxoglutarate aldolase